MRPLEIAFLLVNVPLLALWLWGRPLPRGVRILSALALLLMILQIAVEGPRWHMGPGYLATLGAFLACYRPRWQAARDGVPPLRRLARCGALAFIGLLLGTVVMGSVLPVFDLPEPTGTYPIGTVTLHLVDTGRKESNRPGEYRELMVQFWYPAEYSGPGQPYRTRAETEFKKEHLSLVKTHAAPGVPLAKGSSRFPVVIFSPSWLGRRNQNVVQAEELASHGFVVVGVDHPYGTELTVFPDGRQANTVLNSWLDFSSDEKLEASIRMIEAELKIRTADVRFVLDEVQRLNRADPQGLFTDRLDISRVGVFGHSFGGAVAAEVCLTDARFKTGINLDGCLFGTAARKAIGKPFLVLTDNNPVPTAANIKTLNDHDRRYWTFMTQTISDTNHALSESAGYWAKIDDVGHMNFSDSPLYSPVKRLTGAGPIQPERAMEIIDAYLVAFLQTHLNGNDAGLLDAASSPYAEVVVQRVCKHRSQDAMENRDSLPRKTP